MEMKIDGLIKRKIENVIRGIYGARFQGLFFYKGGPRFE